MGDHSRYTTTPLKTVHGKNRYCGPAAVSAITGLSTDEVSLSIRKETGRHAVMRTHHWELSHVLWQQGYKLRRRTLFEHKCTLARWLRNREPADRCKTFLINVTDHWVVIRGNKFADSKQKEPCFISKAPGRRKRVIKVFEVIKE